MRSRGAEAWKVPSMLIFVCCQCLSGSRVYSRGPLSSHLSVSKSYYNKLSIKGKKLFDAWVDGLRFPEARLVSFFRMACGCS